MGVLGRVFARSRRVSRWTTLLIGATGVVCMAVSGHGHLAPRLTYNASASAPLGWYLVLPPDRLKVDDYVLLNLPTDARRLAAERGYLPETVPLLKRIGAMPNQFVCVRRRHLWVDGELAATALTHDRRGRELVPWQGCRVLDSNEILLISRDNSASFDSRYFGPIPMKNLMGKAAPLWVW
jgi:conjugative transfer signal peptidase TraF